MNNVGFKGFRKPEEVTDESLKAALARLSTSNLYVYWTGNAYKLRPASLRSNALRTITEIKTPIAVEELIRRAARVGGETMGYNPAVVKSGLYLHRNSKPAVYLALERKDDGSFVAATDTPYADGFPQGLKAGDIVLPASAQPAIEMTKAAVTVNKAKRIAPAKVAKAIEHQPELQAAGNKPSGKRIVKKAAKK